MTAENSFVAFKVNKDKSTTEMKQIILRSNEMAELCDEKETYEENKFLEQKESSSESK